jgi:hypothetical protein
VAALVESVEQREREKGAVEQRERWWWSKESRVVVVVVRSKVSR